MMEDRQISKDIVEDVLLNPREIIEEEEGKNVYQGVRQFSNGKNYLVRVFVNVEADPNVIITVYRTSKSDKY